jgi:hypothetical protein
MADVQIQQTPDAGTGGASWVWALVVLVLVALVAWFLFGGGLNRTNTTRIDINTPGEVSTPAPSNAAPSTPAPAPSAGGGATTKKP